MNLTAAEICSRVGGNLLGDGTATVTTAAPVHQARDGSLTYAADESNVRRLATCEARVIIVAATDANDIHAKLPGKTMIAVNGDVEVAFLRIATELCPRPKLSDTGVSPSAMVSPSAQIGENANIHAGVTICDQAEVGENCTMYPGVFIGPGAKVGNNVTLHPNVVINDGVLIGHEVTIHANAVIGAEGFGYRQQDGRHERIPHVGTVRIEDHVEIGACATIDRAKVGETVIGTGTKIDNLVMIGHNCELGQHNLLASQVGFAGSTTTGNYVVCGGQVGVADHVHLGDGAIFGAKSGVHRDMSAGETYLGAPAAPIGETRKQLMAVRKLPAMRKTLRALEQRLAALEAAELSPPAVATDVA